MPKKTKQQPAPITVFYLTTQVEIKRSHAEYTSRGVAWVPDEPSVYPVGTELVFVKDEFVPMIGLRKLFMVNGTQQWLRLTDEDFSNTMPEVQP